MHNEQIFTPKEIVYTIFEELEYNGNNIRGKHIIDNSCGDGAFLREVVKLYVKSCLNDGIVNKQIVIELETYIHGIEIDKDLFKKTIDNLNDIVRGLGINQHVRWDILNGDAMDIDKFNGKMDYVVGNPPYCNVHDLGERYDKVKNYKFANGGMTDLYLVFFEVGIKMLNDNGKLGYITPNSWLTSKAGVNFRNYLSESKTLLKICQYGHKKIFDNVATYCCLTFLSKAPKSNNLFICYIYNDDENIMQTVENLDDCMVNGNIYLADKITLDILRKINEINNKTKKLKNRIKVKNGFATLNDKLFIIDDYVAENGIEENILKVKKASNGESHYFFYPYDGNGKQLNKEDINPNLVVYLTSKARKMDVGITKPTWWLYGRTQALNDVKLNKIIVNNLIRNKEDIKIEILSKNTGIYSGFYIPLYECYDDNMVKKIVSSIRNDGFVSYIKAVGKYKNGGYYTFSSKELEAWLNFCIFKENSSKN